MSTQPLHASAFAYRGVGCLLLGASGSGKSRILAEALLLGAQMIADDQVHLQVENGMLLASAPPPLSGVVELRGLGLVQLPEALAAHPMHLVVSLEDVAAERLPEPQTKELLGVMLPLLTLPTTPPPHAPSLLLYLKAMHAGRILPPDWRALA